MSAVLVAVAIGIACVLALATRVVAEQAARQKAETRALEAARTVAHLEAMLASAGRHEQEWLGVLAHEMRSPVGAILGYSELIADDAVEGPRLRDASLRMAAAAEQILALIRGIEHVALIRTDSADGPAELELGALAAEAINQLRYEADARGTSLDLAATDAPVHGDPDALSLALLLALGAVVKVSNGRSIPITTGPDGAGGASLLASATGLRPDVDDPAGSKASDQGLTGAGLRIALARNLLESRGGSCTIRTAGDGGDLVLTLPAPPPA
jgi:signal transduction histidine kinase